MLCLAPFILQCKNTWPVSCYAFFKGWLLLSQPPGCLCIFTSFPTQQRLRDLSWWSGLFPSRLWSLAPTVRLLASKHLVFRVSKGLVILRPLAQTVLYLQMSSTKAIPKYISERTSYLLVWLAFHSYPQLIRAVFNPHLFRPPFRITGTSPWP